MNTSDKSDRELLELAARAAGRNIRWSGNVAVLQDYRPHFDDCSVWAPLTDDGDAMRLVLTLRLNLNFDKPMVVTVADGNCWQTHEDVGNDLAAATRRAIVRAAANLGVLHEAHARTR